MGQSVEPAPAGPGGTRRAGRGAIADRRSSGMAGSGDLHLGRERGAGLGGTGSRCSRWWRCLRSNTTRFCALQGRLTRCSQSMQGRLSMSMHVRAKGLVAVQQVNSETGVMQPFGGSAWRFARRAGCCWPIARRAQASWACPMPISWSLPRTNSAAPIGVGALLVRDWALLQAERRAGARLSRRDREPARRARHGSRAGSGQRLAGARRAAALAARARHSRGRRRSYCRQGTNASQPSARTGCRGSPRRCNSSVSTVRALRFRRAAPVRRVRSSPAMCSKRWAWTTSPPAK